MSQLDLQATEEIMRELGASISSVLKGVSNNLGFALIVFEFNKPGISNYISSGQRLDMIKALKETVERLEKNQDIPAAIGGRH